MTGNIVDFIKLIAEFVPIFFLIFARTIPLVTVPAPIYGMRNIPTTIRISFAFIFSVFYIIIYKPEAKIPEEIIPYILMLLQELLTGFLFAFSAAVIVNAVQSAGEIIDIQAGLSMIMLMNPATNTQATATGRLFYQIALIVFIVAGGHLYLLSAFFRSFTIVPLGTFAFGGPALNEMIRITGDVFNVGAQLSLPVLVVLFVVDFGLAMMNRVSPQVNVLELNFAMKPTTSMLVFLVALPTFVGILLILTDRLVNYSQRAMYSLARSRPVIVKPFQEPKTDLELQWEDIWK